VNARRVLFYAMSPVKYAMFRPLHERLIEDDRVEVFFAGKLRGRGSSSKMARKLNVLPARIIRRGFASFVRFDAMLTADYELWRHYERDLLPISKTPRIQLFHGVSVRNGGVAPKMEKFQHLFSVGDCMIRAFAEHGIFAPDDPRHHRVGMPKVDRLVDGTYDRDEEVRKLGLDPARPTVLLAPTWLRRSVMQEQGEELLARLADGPWNFLIKLHDRFFDPRYNLPDWRARLRAFEGRGNCAVIDDYDAVPTMIASDVMISDVSSIANEFTLLDRPLVFLKLLDIPRLKRQYPRLDLDTWGQRTGEIASGARECVAAVERAIGDPGQRSEIRRAAAEDIFFHRGSATEAALRALYDIIELDPPATLGSRKAAAAGPV